MIKLYGVRRFGKQILQNYISIVCPEQKVPGSGVTGGGRGQSTGKKEARRKWKKGGKWRRKEGKL